MNNKQLIKNLNNAYTISTSSNKTKFLRKIRKPDTSLFSFIKNQFKLINSKAYISCFVYFVVLLVLLFGSYSQNQYIFLAAGVPFFSLVLVYIVNTSNTYNMEELEMATLYSLKMVILARMLIMAVVTMSCISLMALFTSIIKNISLINILCYFFIPYFLNMYINLKILKKYRNNGLKYCFVISSIICLLILFLIDKPTIVITINKYIYLFALIVLAVLSINESKKYIYGLEEHIWNLN